VRYPYIEYCPWGWFVTQYTSKVRRQENWKRNRRRHKVPLPVLRRSIPVITGSHISTRRCASYHAESFPWFCRVRSYDGCDCFFREGGEHAVSRRRRPDVDGGSVKRVPERRWRCVVGALVCVCIRAEVYLHGAVTTRRTQSFDDVVGDRVYHGVWREARETKNTSLL